ncbi:hypothetical protein QAD02_007372 [Eretmocerus hayati]|uniref:Uncharacterized protein n=1 Tax=Eretmocerus hayati TaxID=131215 RepID=A0ACC2N3F8_9HYME|nr:hypothetical protein QAD02_007372 [Eretmocerus hayati]
MPPKRSRKVKTEDEIDVVGIDPCDEAIQAIDNAAKATVDAVRQVELGTQQEQQSDDLAQNDDVQIIKQIFSVDLAAPPKSENKLPSNLQKILVNVRSAPERFDNKRVQQERRAAEELAGRGYASQVLDILGKLAGTLDQPPPQEPSEARGSAGALVANTSSAEEINEPMDLTLTTSGPMLEAAPRLGEGFRAAVKPRMFPETVPASVKYIFASSMVRETGATYSARNMAPMRKPVPTIAPMPRPSMIPGQPQPCLGSPAVGIKVGFIPETPLFAPQDQLERELFQALRTGKPYQIGEIRDSRNRLIVKRTGIIMIQPNRLGWRCEYCFLEDNQKYGGWKGWPVHEMCQIGALEDFEIMRCIDCGRDPLRTSGLDGPADAIVTCKREWGNINKGKIVEMLTAARAGCLCNQISSEMLHALAAARAQRG